MTMTLEQLLKKNYSDVTDRMDRLFHYTHTENALAILKSELFTLDDNGHFYTTPNDFYNVDAMYGNIGFIFPIEELFHDSTIYCYDWYEGKIPQFLVSKHEIALDVYAPKQHSGPFQKDGLEYKRTSELIHFMFDETIELSQCMKIETFDHKQCSKLRHMCPDHLNKNDSLCKFVIKCYLEQLEFDKSALISHLKKSDVYQIDYVSPAIIGTIRLNLEKSLDQQKYINPSPEDKFFAMQVIIYNYLKEISDDIVSENFRDETDLDEYLNSFFNHWLYVDNLK